ncbi:MAG: imidazole glycerol phosphate synthase subunit HisH [Gammaproteobacteria bacterium TMED119]|nr:MAG: imidazole glycerol phosphate synthase subunit HisH [Gammaproteobacteria bacterium TMED119]
MKKIAVVDYGMSNLHSVTSALKAVANDQQVIEVCQRPEDIDNADRIVFPGQGAAADCMQQIRATGLVTALQQAASEKPFLGICMGMQVLMETSDENGGTDCLAMFKGSVKQFGPDMPAADGRLKVPHMGWNQIRQTLDHPVWHGIAQDSYFYFVHSYYVALAHAKQQVGRTHYGVEFTSVLAQGYVFAMQCHPEKSADNGLQLLTNFLNWSGK